jgi:O-antigen polymerase
MVLGFLLVPAFVLLFFTFSRTGWITLSVGVLVVHLLLKRMLVGAALGCLLGLALFVGDIFPLLVDRFRPDSAFYLRFTLVRLGWELFKEAPLFGHGVGTFPLLSGDTLGIVIERHGVAMGLAPHNDLIRFLVEGGLLGLAFYCIVLLTAARIGHRLARRGDQNFEGPLGVFLVSATVTTFVFGLAGQGLSFSAPYLLGALGIGAALDGRRYSARMEAASDARSSETSP